MVKILETLERWADIPEFENMYQISSKGRLRSLDRLAPAYNIHGNFRGYNRLKGKVMRPGNSPNGYKIACLTKNGIKNHFSMHRLVAKAFIPNPLNLPEVNHLDGDKTNNSIENLQWSTASDNQKHAYETGLAKRVFGSDVNGAVLDELQVKVIRSIALEANISQIEIARYFGVSQTLVSAIKNNKIWKHLQ